eukprot:GFUD01067366.1.p1 GENE.GFUD01067366.1~~GFUD01067366.1.p1  ORF type:complete len:498 (+),score=126.46 GFUD01067366.1:88-1581(+)
MRKDIFIAFGLLALVWGTPLPQDPNDEVEVISGPVSTNEGDFDGFGGFSPRVRVFVIPVQDTDYDYEERGSSNIGGFLEILKSILGARSYPTLTESKVEVEQRACLLCDLLQDTFTNVQGQIDDVRNRENEVDFVEGEDGFDINNSTHTQKVLEDGTVLHINKTTISDTDEDGNSFFFHKTVFHNVGGDEQNNTDEEEFDIVEEAEELETGIDDGLTCFKSGELPVTCQDAENGGGGGGGWPQEPEAESNYIARGEMVDLDPNMKGYLVGSGQKVVVWSTGMYGITGDNNKKKRTKEWADFLAEEGGYTVLIPDWFRGNNMPLGPFGPVFGPELAIWSRQVTNSTRILDDWQNVVLPYLEAKLTSNLNIGLVGTCWGSYPVVYLSRFDNVKFGISMHASHPGLIMSVNETESEVLSQIVAPQLFMTEGSYGVPGIEVPPSILPGGLADQVLGDKIQFEVFTDMKHGWTTGGDLSDPDVARDVDKAKTLALEVLAKYL